MALTIADFIGHIKKNNVARANRYDIVFNLPSTLVDYMNQNNTAPTVGSNKTNSQTGGQSPVSSERMMSLSCLGTEIPSVSASANELDYGNYARRVAFNRTVNDFNTTFIVTGNYAEKKIFDAWQDIMFHQNNHRVEYYDNYITSLSVTCYDLNNNPVYQFELTEAYPITVGEIQLDRTSQNTQMILDVKWAFHRIIHNGTNYTATLNTVQNNPMNAVVNNMVGSTPASFVESAVASSTIDQANGVVAAVNNGDISKGDGLMLVKQISQSFKSAKDIPPGDAEAVSNHLDNVQSTLDDSESTSEVPYDE